jgi:hypothetical protein
MLSTFICAALLASPSPQVINGIRPAIDGMVPYAQAYAKYSGDDLGLITNKDYFAIGYFGYKAKFMSALTNTKYTAAVMGICGTMLGLWDAESKKAVKTGTDRISSGSKDFDTFTQAERDAIGKALTNDTNGMFPITMQQKKPEVLMDYSTGMALGGLSAYITLWHISPKQPILLEYISTSVDSCATAGTKLTNPARKDLADQLKLFAQFKGKTIDEPTVREIAKQIELTLRSSVPEKYRWTPVSK